MNTSSRPVSRNAPVTAEQRRLNQHHQHKANWQLWGPYLAERAWGTVREDYSSDGDAWAFFPHEHARSRAYRWNEDGLMGFCDRQQLLCFSVALWNGEDPYLKERLFGLSGPEGNHGEDVKELYWYLDSTPTHSYARMRYRYPQSAFPYDELRTRNAERGYTEPEFELTDTTVFNDERWFDVTTTYAKAADDDILIEITVHNRATHTARLSLIPQLWFRNTWSWGYADGPQANAAVLPGISADISHPDSPGHASSLIAEHPASGRYHLYWQGKPETLFTNNDSNRQHLYGSENRSPWTKDAFHRAIVNGDQDALNPEGIGTKAGLHFRLKLAAGESRTVQLRLSARRLEKPFVGFRPLINRRRKEADAFYTSVQPASIDKNLQQIQRQALAGMLWSKQLYYYNIQQWYKGDPALPVTREDTRNSSWQHLDNFDVLSMPDKWEYPWYAVWDTAFHCLPLAMTDINFAKRQLTVMTREWYMHPSGQLPAYEWAFGDVNPPVHAWSALTVYRMEADKYGKGDRRFLESIFQKLLLNFTWWVNRKDSHGQHIFSGGFLGLDNISIFDRSEEPPTGGVLNQSDGTAWMGFFSVNMLHIALELAKDNPAYEDMASKFLEHFLHIAQAINNENAPGLWHDSDGFYYDRLHLPDNQHPSIKVRSLVGLLPLIAVGMLEENLSERTPDYARRMQWLLQKQPELAENLNDGCATTGEPHHLLSFVNADRLRSILKYMLDEDEFLSPFGIRSLSRVHADTPYTFKLADGTGLSLQYEPNTGETDLFGGNSNWRGPVWFPINYLLIEALRQHHRHYGDNFKVECPTGSGLEMTLEQVADELSQRLISLFEKSANGRPPWCGDDQHLARSAEEGLHLFFEYFNGDTGAGLGASHQTGWTGLVAMLIQQQAR
ncbi:MAG: glucosidase [Granulosicoccus sp.]